MTIELATLPGGIRISAATAGWELRRVSGTPGGSGIVPPAEWRANELEVEQLLELGFADEVDDAVVVSWRFFGDAIEAGFGLVVAGVEDSPLMLAIDRTDDIGSPEFQYRYDFRLGADRVSTRRVGYFVELVVAQRVVRLDAQTFAIVEAMDRFNNLQPAARTKQESWLTFACVKGASEETGAALDATLSSNDVIIPSHIGLRIFRHADESISFVPVSDNLPDPAEADAFQQAFLTAKRVDGVYTIDRADGRRLRVVLTPRHREVLERMKQVQRVRGADQERAVRHPEHFFDGLIDSVDLRYWARVTGVGELPLSTIPKGAGSGAGFLDIGEPGQDSPERETKVRVVDTDGRKVELRFQSRVERDAVRQAVEDARERRDETVVIQDHTLPVSDELSVAIGSEPVQDDEPRERGTRGGRLFLMIHSNEDDLWQRPIPTAQDTLDEGALEQLHASWRAPQSLTGSLKKHQVAALRWLHVSDGLRPGRRGVLLADDMGLGKTLQILTHLAGLIEKGRLSDRPGQDSRVGPWRPILIVAPLILVENETWTREMSRFFASDGELFKPILVLHGSGIARVKVRGASQSSGAETEIGRPTLDADALMQYRVVITNYETVVNYQHSLAQLKDGRPLWSVIVTDEAQKYKSPGTKISFALKAIDCEFHIASTGTPVENRLLDLWNIFDAIQPSHLGTAREFCAKYEQADESQQSEGLAMLRASLNYGERRALLLRRTKQELLAGELPEKAIVRVPCQMSVEEVRAHEELLSVLSAERAAGRHLAVLHRLTQLYQHPALLRDRSSRGDAPALLAESSKLRAVVNTLREIQQKGEKAIIFARLIDVQQMLSTVIEHEFGVKVPIINGATQTVSGIGTTTAGSGRAKDRRKATLDAFRAIEGFGVLILSPFVAGIGLTITEANHVIHYGRWWNPAVEAQATDRAYRIGQERPVSVYLPILDDPTGTLTRTFDQLLDALLTKKSDLASDFLQPADIEDQCIGELIDELLPNDGTRHEGGSDSTQSFTAEDLDKLSHTDFEAAVAALFAARGIPCVLTAAAGDGGADVIVVRPGRVSLVQVKHSAAGNAVDARAIADVLGALDIYRQEFPGTTLSAELVTNSAIGRDARVEAKSCGVELVERAVLARMMSEHRVGLGQMVQASSGRARSFQDGVRSARSLISRAGA